MPQLHLCDVREESTVLRAQKIRIVAYFGGDESDNQTITAEIKYLRELLGLPPIIEKTAECRRCNKTFLTQIKNGAKQVHFCRLCRYSISRTDSVNIMSQS